MPGHELAVITSGSEDAATKPMAESWDSQPADHWILLFR